MSDHFKGLTTVGATLTVESMREAREKIKEWEERDAALVDFNCYKCRRSVSVPFGVSSAYLRSYPNQGVFATCEFCICGIDRNEKE